MLPYFEPVFLTGVERADQELGVQGSAPLATVDGTTWFAFLILILASKNEIIEADRVVVLQIILCTSGFSCLWRF